MDGCFPRCKNKQQSVAECVAVTRYIYITHVFSDKRRENKGLVQITSSQNILLLSATSTSCLHGAPLARRPPFLHCDMPKSKQWLCSHVLCLISVMEKTLSLFPCLFPSGTSFGADCGQSERVFSDAAAIGQKPSMSSLTSDQNPRAVLPGLVGKHMGTEERQTAFFCDFSLCKDGFITCMHKLRSSFDAFHGIHLNELHLSQR